MKYNLHKNYIILTTLVCFVPLLIFNHFLADLFLVLSCSYFLFFFYTKKLILNKSIFLFFFLFWYLYLIILSFSSENILLSLESSLFYFRFGIFSLVVYYLDRKFENFKRYFFFSLLFFFIILFLDSLIQYFFLSNLFGMELTSNRLSSFFGKEKILGSFISKYIIILLSLFTYLFFDKKYFNYLFTLILNLSLILVILSSERNAFVFIILIYFFSFIFIIDSFKFKFYNFLALLILMTTLLFFNPAIKNRIIDETLHQTQIVQSIINQDITKLNIFSEIYEDYYKTSYKIFTDNVLFGVGPKMFREACKNTKFNTGNGCSTHPHNYYLQLLAETGIFGFILVFTIWIISFYYILKHLINIKKVFNNKELKYQLFLLFGVFLMFFPFIPTGNFFNSWLNIYNFLVIGFLISSYKNIVIFKNS